MTTSVRAERLLTVAAVAAVFVAQIPVTLVAVS